MPSARGYEYLHIYFRRHSGKECRNPEHRDVMCIRHPWHLDPGNPCRGDDLARYICSDAQGWREVPGAGEEELARDNCAKPLGKIRPSIPIRLSRGWQGSLLATVLLWTPSAMAGGGGQGDASAVLASPFTQAECLECHGERDASLVEQWRVGPHGATADCIACHGRRHNNLPAARADSACTGCHGGPVEDSYTKSKHGVLVHLGRPDWTNPLQRGAYRAPGCAYCHLHDRDHRDSMDPDRGASVGEWICSGCHAPRYVNRQLEAGQRLLEIARLKAEEAAAVAARHPGGEVAVEDLLGSVQLHLRNVRLGAGHQSPDYQWWLGQPAMDGDLIRLRDAVEIVRREHTSLAISER